MLLPADLYIIIISKWSENERIGANGQPLKFLMPLLEFHINQLEGFAGRLYERFRNEDFMRDYEHTWRPLRETLVNARLPFEAFNQYDLCHANGSVRQSNQLQRLSRRFENVLHQSSKIEQHMRDELQFQIGHLSLQESKESIKQSKIAIEESKRVKMRM
jgi:hypothetical protein